MDNLVKVEASVVKYSKNSNSSFDNFYMDGRYKHEYELDNIQVSVERSGEEHIFAVCHGMDRMNPETGMQVSMVRELKKFHEQMRGRGGDLESKLGQLSERVDEINGVIHSLSLGQSSMKDILSSFAGIFIDKGRAAALNTGDSRIYLLRGGDFKQLTGNSDKAERLLRAGIITRDQAKTLSSRLGIPALPNRIQMQKSMPVQLENGDVFLLCSGGILNVLDDDFLYDVLSKERDTGYMSNAIVREALKKSVQGEATVLVVRVLNTGNENEISSKHKEKPALQKASMPVDSRKLKTAIAYIAAGVACVVATGILLNSLYKLWYGSSNQTNGYETVSAEAKTYEAPTGEIGGQLSEESNGGADIEEQDKSQAGSNVSEESDAGELIIHKVRPGETLQSISKKYYDDYEKYTLIMERNNIKDPKKLQAGQELIIPSQ